ncbi:MAG: MATE family efflux transporter [Elusimicrobiota bacterium]
MSGIKRDILRIAGPAVSGYVSLIVYELVDIFWIAKLGTETVAGVAAAEYWTWAMHAIMGMTTIGCATLVAQSIGARDEEGARTAARESAHLSLLVSAALAVTIYLSAPALLRWMGLSPQAHTAGWTYLRILVLSLPLLYLIHWANQIFNAHGDTKTAVLIMAVALTVNAGMDPVLIFGWWGFPAMGVAGAAAATVLGWTTGLLLRVVFLRRRGYIAPLGTYLKFSAGYFGRILKVGVPTGASHLIWTSVYPLLTTLITRFGMAPLAGMTIGHRLESMAYFTSVGFSVATATLVGQAVGRGDFETARRTTYESRKLITLILLPVCVAFVFFPEALLGIATKDPDTIAHGASYLRKIGLLEIFLGWEMVFEGGFNGLGSTRPYMYISIPLTLGRYPLSYLLVAVLGFGVDAIWWCISVTTLLKGVLMSRAFARARAADLGVRRGI